MRPKRFWLHRLGVLLASGAFVVGLTAAPPAAAVEVDAAELDVEIVLDPDYGPKEVYDIGETIGFQLKVTNKSAQTRSVTVTDSNLTNYAGCKWRAIDPGVTKTDCKASAANHFITHVVTKEDVLAGSFTPSVALKTQQAGYLGDTIATTGTITGEPVAVHASHFWIEALSTDVDTETTFRAGDEVVYTATLAGVSPHHAYSVVESSFDTVGQCAPDGAGVVSCGPLTHTMTDADALNQTWQPKVAVAAVDAAGGEVHREVLAAAALNVAGDYPQAVPAPAVDADPSLSGDITAPVALAESRSGVNYRIPAVATAPNGDLLVSYDERPTGNWMASGGDSPNPNSIVQRRSTDGGKTWGPPTYIHRGNPTTDTSQIEGYSDPSYVVDQQTGAIFNFHVKSFRAGLPNASSRDNHPDNRDVVHAEVSVSTDNGYTWTHRVITEVVNPDKSSVWRFAASGQGIQIQNGPHAGRLVQQFTEAPYRGGPQIAFSVYSDDHGATWQRGQGVGTHMDENKVVELSDGSLMLNSRDRDSSGRRIVALSRDGGQTWTGERMAQDLPDSRNNAQLIRAFPNATGDDPRAKVLLFTNASGYPGTGSWSVRDRGTLSVSCDDGNTWLGANKRVFNAGNTGYSTIAVQQDGRLGLVSEDNGRGIYYRSLPLSWIGAACPTVTATGTQVEAGVREAQIAVAITDAVGTAPSGTLAVTGLPEGWSAQDVELEAGAEGAIRLALPRDAAVGEHALTVEMRAADGTVMATTNAVVNVTAAVRPAYVEQVAAAGSGTVLFGDWDGDGRATYGVRVGTRVVLYAENANDAKPLTVLVLGRAADRVYVGDWDGDGRDSLALVRGTTALLQTHPLSAATQSIKVPKGDLEVTRQEGKDVLVPKA
ncbi:sialidase family protein [Actinomyces sp.]|uniref:sialidase family protein n=1 Tax=Actinomyces sp. TaxID=29317 RepID=UPI0026DD9665|nr:sialidase family protein [Actinomyces sp.]MDO4900012.1 sialidase family protein [Actinomyces sp.]